MPNIDPDKLRRFRSDARSAHAALLRAFDMVGDARKVLADARSKLEGIQNPPPGIMRPTAEQREAGFRGGVKLLPTANHEQLAIDAVKRAEAAFARAEEERDRLEDAWTHASRIWTRCRDFAAEHGALPNDLKD